MTAGHSGDITAFGDKVFGLYECIFFYEIVIKLCFGPFQGTFIVSVYFIPYFYFKRDYTKLS